MEYNSIKEILENRPWYQKLWSRILVYHWMCKSDVDHFMMKKPINLKAIDKTADWIKDDIEFGYSIDMIYDKIKLGQYGNTPTKES